jgi:hypothetical protein
MSIAGTFKEVMTITVPAWVLVTSLQRRISSVSGSRSSVRPEIRQPTTSSLAIYGGSQPSLVSLQRDYN